MASQPRWRRAALAAILAAAAYVGSIQPDFVFDDGGAIVDNGVVTGKLPWTAALQRDFWGRRGHDSVNTWRPLVSLSFRADWRRGHGSPESFHVTNVVLHAVATALVALSFGQVFPASTALAAAALFAVLAGSSEAVESLAGRADVLLTIFVLLGFSWHVRGRTLLAAMALAAALGCKETAIFAPGVWIVLGPSARRRVSPAALYAAVLASGAALRLAALGTLHAPAVDLMRNPLASAGVWQRALGAGRIFARFTAAGIVDPFRRLYVCSGPACGPSDATDPVAWAGLGLLVLLAIAPIVLWRRAPGVARALAFFDAFFLPVSNVLVVSSSVYAERLLYLPLVGLSFAVAHALLSVRPAEAGGLLLAAIGLLNLAAVQRRHRDFRDSVSLYLSALPIAPDSAQVQQNAAVAEYRLHHADLAEQHARTSLELWPGNPQAQSVLASSLDRQGRTAEAELLFVEATTRSGLDVDIAADYARFLQFHGRRSEALELARRASAAHPDSTALEPLVRRLSR